MANDYQNFTCIGRLGRDPETNIAAGGTSVTKFSVAVSEKYKDKESTLWMRCVVFGKLGEVCQTYLTKGSKVLLSGKLTQSEWEKDGVKQVSIEMNVRDMQMLDSKPKSDEDEIKF